MGHTVQVQDVEQSGSAWKMSHLELGGRYSPAEFLRAMSSALEVLRCSMRRLGMLKGGTCMLSELYWCLSGRWRSGLGRDRLSSFSLFLWFLYTYIGVLNGYHIFAFQQ